MMFLRLRPGFGIEADGQEAWDVSLTGANEFRLLPGVHEDAETWWLTTRYAKGLGKGWEAWGELPLASRGGGFMDPLIEWWHGAFGQGTRGRDLFPRGQSEIDLNGNSFGSGSGLGDVSFGVGKQLGPRTSAHLGVKLPTGNPAKLLGSGGVDAGLSVDHAVPLNSRLSLHLQGGFIAQSPSTALPSARGLVPQACVALEYRPNTRDGFIVQWNSESSPTVSGVAGVDAAHRVMTFAYRRKLNESASLDLYFSEDGDWRWLDFPGGPDVGPDFTVGFRLRIAK